MNEKFMARAIELSIESVKKGTGPFGACVVKDNKIISEGFNTVTLPPFDVSSHAEISAIRKACEKLNNFSLKGCELYTSCECCPMCYSTAYWANIRRVFYAASWSDYDDLFSDRAINDDIRRAMPEKQIRMEQILQDEAQAVWNEFRQLPDGARY